MKCVETSKDDYVQLLAKYQPCHIFKAVRHPTRKRTFQLRTQVGFNQHVASTILITPYTVAVIISVEELLKQTKLKHGILYDDK